MKNNLLNIALFQIGWFACVLSAAAGQPIWGAAISIMIIGWHVWRASAPFAEFKLIMLAMLIGLIWDSFLVWQHWLDYESGILLANTAPYWIVLMWALFATTLNVSMRWLKGRWLYAVLFGAIGGPLAFLAGQRLGAVTFTDTTIALSALVTGWAVLTPLLIAIAQRYDGYPQTRANT